MRVSKLDEGDFKEVRSFVHASEAMLDRGKFSLQEPYEEWNTWDDDDDDKQLLLKIKKNICQNEEIDEDDIDLRIVAYEYLRRKFTGRLTLCLLTAQMLIDNCTDPQKDYLDFHPSFYTNHVAPEQ